MRPLRRTWSSIATASGLFLAMLPITVITAAAATSVLPATITTCAATSQQASEFAGGSGTSADPFQVDDTEALTAINSDDTTRACAYTLTADITLSGEWVPIGVYDSDGNNTSSFSGIFDGNGKSISGMSITSAIAPHDSAGLFGHIAGGQVKNLSIAGTIDINTHNNGITGNYQGILAGLIDGSTVTNVHVTGSNTGTGALGGLVGGVFGSADIIGSSADVRVSTTWVHAWNVGGLVGRAYGPCVIRGSWATGAISGTSFTGGLVGGIWPSALGSCRIEESFSTGNVTASKASSGGLVGLVNSDAASVGGAVIRNSFASGTVTGARGDIGGLIGKINASGNAFNHVVANSYAMGTVSFSGSGTTTAIGGLIGTIGTGTGPPVITNSFWDTQASGEDTSAGGTGLTTAAMKTVSTFADSDWAIDCPSGPSTWSIDPAVNNGYPYLTGNVGTTGCNSTPPASPTPPAPIPPTPAGAPTGLSAESPTPTAARITWNAPATSGSYPITTYQVTTTPGSAGCLATTTTCTITRLAPDTTYTAKVRALTGAGWSPWSQTLTLTTPPEPPAPAIVITGARGDGNDKRTIYVTGTTTGLTDATLTPQLQLGTTRTTITGNTQITPKSDGNFTWKRRTPTAARITFTTTTPTGDTIRSRTLTIPAPGKPGT